MNIYYIKSRPLQPVGDAGAVVIAPTPKEALALCKNTLLDPQKPKLLGVASSASRKAQVIFINNGDY